MSIIIEYGLLHKRPISIIDSIVLIKKVGMQVNGEFFAEMEKKKKKKSSVQRFACWNIFGSLSVKRFRTLWLKFFSYSVIKVPIYSNKEINQISH